MLKVNIISAQGFNPDEKAKLNGAVKLIESVVNSDAFKNVVINHQFKGKAQFNENQGMTNQQIYDLFMSGKESTNNDNDSEMDFKLSISTKCPKTAIGTTFNRGRTETYRCKLADMTDAGYAGHLVHEWCHYLGFKHSKKPTPDRPYTVPYAIGYMVRNLSGLISANLSNELVTDLNSRHQNSESYSSIPDSSFID